MINSSFSPLAFASDYWQTIAHNAVQERLQDQTDISIAIAKLRGKLIKGLTLLLQSRVQGECALAREQWYANTGLSNADMDILHEYQLVEKVGTQPQPHTLIYVTDDAVSLASTYVREWSIASAVMERLKWSEQAPLAINLDGMDAILARLSARQRSIVERSATQRVAMITGGPGTGKTTIIKRIIQLRMHAGLYADEIALSAPTGKAVQRLHESFAEIGSMVSLATFSTLHRLLGLSSATGALKRRYTLSKARLYRLIIIDEASMLDYALLDELLAQAHKDCQIILVGDENQLGPIGLGEPFRMLALSLRSMGVVHELTETFRFSEASNIYKLSQAVLYDQADLFIETINQQSLWLDPEQLKLVLYERYQDYYDALSRLNKYRALSDESIADLFARSEQFKILTSHRHGNLGALMINQLLDQWMHSASMGHDRGAVSSGMTSRHYTGQILMATENDYIHQVYNGDIGICIWQEGIYRFVRSTSEGDTDGLGIPIAQLSSLEPAYALTIHKSQGSEYDKVLCLLGERTDALIKDDRKESPLLSSALIYTAITRAKSEFALMATSDVLSETLNTRPNRLAHLSALLNSQIA